MHLFSLWSTLALAAVLLGCTLPSASSHATWDAEMLGHRGGARHLIPEHSRMSYTLGYQYGADWIEPDIVSTKDGHLLCMHDFFVNDITDLLDDNKPLGDPKKYYTKDVDIWTRNPDFAEATDSPLSYKPKKMSGYFVWNFTLAEIRKLKLNVLDAQTQLGDGWSPLNGILPVMTLNETLELLNELREHSPKSSMKGVIPEVKKGYMFERLGLPIVPKLIATLKEYGYGYENVVDKFKAKKGGGGVNVEANGTGVIIQAFDPYIVKQVSELWPETPRLALLIPSDPVNQDVVNYLMNETLVNATIISVHMSKAKTADRLRPSKVGLVKPEDDELKMAMMATTKRPDGADKDMLSMTDSRPWFPMSVWTLTNNLTKYLQMWQFNADSVFSDDICIGTTMQNLLNDYILDPTSYLYDFSQVRDSCKHALEYADEYNDSKNCKHKWSKSGWMIAVYCLVSAWLSAVITLLYVKFCAKRPAHSGFTKMQDDKDAHQGYGAAEAAQ